MSTTNEVIVNGVATALSRRDHIRRGLEKAYTDRAALDAIIAQGEEEVARLDTDVAEVVTFLGLVDVADVITAVEALRDAWDDGHREDQRIESVRLTLRSLEETVQAYREDQS